MKWLIYLLVLANVAFFAWQYRQADEAATVPRTTPAVGGRHMALVSEVDVSALELRDGPAKEGKQPSSARQPSREETSRVTPSSTLAARKVPAPRPVTDQAKQAEAPERKAPTRLSSRAATASVSRPTQRCYTMGPFAAEESVDNLITWLRERGGRTESRWGEQKKPNRYWVYLPPLKTVEEARAMLRRLNDDGFQDYVRVMRGPMRNAISLGLFSQRKFADQRMVQLRNKGYEPSMDIRYKTERVRWLDIVFAGKPGFSETTFRVEYPKVTWVAARCRPDGKIAATRVNP